MTKPANMTVRELQSLRNEGHDDAADEITRLRTELANARAIDIHSCHDGCTRAGCVAAGLREELAQYKSTAISINVMHRDCHKAADEFWLYWREVGETHKRGYYESTWGAINRALRAVGVVPHKWPQMAGTVISAARKAAP